MLQRSEHAKRRCIAVLEDRKHLPSGSLSGRCKPVRVGERTGDRLLADDVLAGRQRIERHRHVHHRRQADVDDLDIRIGQHGFDAGIDRGNGSGRLFAGQPRVQVADMGHRETVAERQIAVEMLGADAGTQDGDPPAHARCPSRVAMACACSASSITLKQCSCPIAVSVRSRTSRMRLAK